MTGISNENDDMDITSLLWLHLGPFCFGWVITGGLMMAALSLLGETETRVGAPAADDVIREERLDNNSPVLLVAYD